MHMCYDIFIDMLVDCSYGVDIILFIVTVLVYVGHLDCLYFCRYSKGGCVLLLLLIRLITRISQPAE